MTDDEAQPLERVCTLWVHDNTFSRRPVIFNKALLAGQGRSIQPGTLLKVVRTTAGVAVHDFQNGDDRPEATPSESEPQTKQSDSEAQPAGAQAAGLQVGAHEGSHDDRRRRHLVFVLEDLDSDYLVKHPSLQVLPFLVIAMHE